MSIPAKNSAQRPLALAESISLRQDEIPNIIPSSRKIVGVTKLEQDYVWMFVDNGMAPNIIRKPSFRKLRPNCPFDSPSTFSTRLNIRQQPLLMAARLTLRCLATRAVMFDNTFVKLVKLMDPATGPFFPGPVFDQGSRRIICGFGVW